MGRRENHLAERDLKTISNQSQCKLLVMANRKEARAKNQEHEGGRGVVCVMIWTPPEACIEESRWCL